MRITVGQLRRIIREEVDRMLETEASTLPESELSELSEENLIKAIIAIGVDPNTKEASALMSKIRKDLSPFELKDMKEFFHLETLDQLNYVARVYSYDNFQDMGRIPLAISTKGDKIIIQGAEWSDENDRGYKYYENEYSEKDVNI